MDMFSPRQLLAMATITEELRNLREEIVSTEGEDVGEATLHLLAFIVDKFVNYNSNLCSWHAPRAVMRSVFDRHDFSFKITFAEMAPCGSSTGFRWATSNVIEAYEELAKLASSRDRKGVQLSKGSATSLPTIASASLEAVVVDPPYDDNVQYSELAEVLQASKGSISTMTRMLIQIGLIERISLPGDRRDYFQIKPNAWSQMTKQRLAQITAFRELAEKGLDLLKNASPHQQQRLQEMRDIHAFLEREMPRLDERWEIEQKQRLRQELHP